MKLLIQIPCLNEAEGLPLTVAALPREVGGFDTVEYVVVDDGSMDDTAKVARCLEVDHIIKLRGHQGLARAFIAGLVTAIELGADVIVNTDADNQYNAANIRDLVAPILEGRADMVIGARPLSSIAHFSPVKRLLQILGSRVVRAISGTEVQDATSGFRAMTREAALHLNVFGSFTYTIETIIQAGLSNLRVVSVPITVNPPLRPSRLFRSNTSYVVRSILTICWVYLIYRAHWLFGALSAALLLPGLALVVRYLYFMGAGVGTGHVQSVVACAIFLLSGMFTSLIGVVAHLLSINRRLLQEVRYLLRSRRAGGDADVHEHGNGSPARLRAGQSFRQVPF